MLQKYTIEETRHGIPLILDGGTIHGIFALGGSYTTFEISDVHAEKHEMSIGKENQVCVTVKNTGFAACADVIQLYLRDVIFSVARPMIELKGFQKVYLRPGESKTVRFALTEKELGFYNANLEYVVEPGRFR